MIVEYFTEAGTWEQEDPEPRDIHDVVTGARARARVDQGLSITNGERIALELFENREEVTL